MKGRGKPSLAVAGVLIIGSILSLSRPARSQQQSISPAQQADHYRAVVSQYCVTCHNEKAKTGGLSLEKMDFSNVAAGADVWEKAVRKLRVGMMPPQGSPQPDVSTRTGLVSWLTTELDRVSAVKPNP